MIPVRAIVVLSLAGALAACSSPGPSGASAAQAPVATAFGVAGAENRGASIAARGADAVVTWTATTGETTDVYAAVSRDGGATFGAPVRVNTIDGDARFTGEQAARVAMAGNVVAVTWQSRTGGTSAIRLARSIDGGRSFLPAATVHESSLAGTRGWASLALDTNGTAHIVWLDTRPSTGAPTQAAAAAPMPPGHVHGEHKTTRQNVYHVAVSGDGARRESLIASDVCFCCKTSVATSGDGTVYAAWRHIYPPNLRDMAVARSTDGGRTFSAPTRVSEDGWAIDGCPEDGPSLGVDATGIVHIAWPTLTAGVKDLRKSIFYSYSTDGGRTFAPRLQVDSGDVTRRPAHPQLAVSGDRVIVTWDEGDGDDRRIRARAHRSTTPGGWSPAAGEPVTIGEDRFATYPAVANTDAGTVLAWTVGAPATAVRVMRIEVP